MSLHIEELLTVEIDRGLGNYRSHYEHVKQGNSPLTPVLNVTNMTENRNIKEYLIEPGYIDIYRRFYSCPYNIFYCQPIKYIESSSHDSTFKVEFNFRLYSKDYKKKREFTMTFEQTADYPYILEWRSFDKVINILNLYIDNGFDLDELELENRCRRDFILLTRNEVIKVIRGLRFSIFENCSYKVGDDNSYWDEAEVTNLPTNEYLKRLIFKCLKEQSREVYHKEYGFLVQFYISRHYSSSYNRRKKSGNNSAQINSIRDILIFEVAKEFDEYAHLFYKINSNNNLGKDA